LYTDSWFIFLALPGIACVEFRTSNVWAENGLRLSGKGASGLELFMHLDS
jgi:hypothetical protein